MVDAIAGLPEGAKFQILAPIVRGRKGEYRKELLEMRKAGYAGSFMNFSVVAVSLKKKALGKEIGGVVVSQVVPSPRSSATPSAMRRSVSVTERFYQGARRTA